MSNNAIYSNINSLISEMEQAVVKGQRYIKRNKTKQIRAALRKMRSEQYRNPTFADLWHCLKRFVSGWFYGIGK